MLSSAKGRPSNRRPPCRRPPRLPRPPSSGQSCSRRWKRNRSSPRRSFTWERLVVVLHRRSPFPNPDSLSLSLSLFL